MPKHTLLLGLTTTWGSDWRAKVKEINKFNIEQISLFATALEKPERRELYDLLEKSKLKKIRHTHLREQDMGKDELDYLSQKWDCRLFNLHPTKRSAEAIKNLPEYQNRIYIENTGGSMPDNYEQMVRESAGICFDLSHYHDYGVLQNLTAYDNFTELLKKYPIGCAHISAITKVLKTSEFDAGHETHYNRHGFTSLNEFDYVKNYIKYLPQYTSLELENSFEEQLEAKAYIEVLFQD